MVWKTLRAASFPFIIRVQRIAVHSMTQAARPVRLKNACGADCEQSSEQQVKWVRAWERKLNERERERAPYSLSRRRAHERIVFCWAGWAGGHPLQSARPPASPRQRASEQVVRRSTWKNKHCLESTTPRTLPKGTLKQYFPGNSTAWGRIFAFWFDTRTHLCWVWFVLFLGVALSKAKLNLWKIFQGSKKLLKL